MSYILLPVYNFLYLVQIVTVQFGYRYSNRTVPTSKLMAKWGEGDPRWIVEERADAHNVNNWHWRESDATQWSKNRFRSEFEECYDPVFARLPRFISSLLTLLLFSALLDGMKVEDENVGCCTLSDVSCEGEASVSNRKNKIICFYEWSIKAKWKGRVKASCFSFVRAIALGQGTETQPRDGV